MVAKATKADSRCAFCLTHEQLQSSHIIPEFMYKQNYTSRHGSIGIRVRRNGAVSASRIQKGLREPLLCRGCEGYFAKRFETPFAQAWNGLNTGRSTSVTEAVVHQTQDADVIRVTGLDYSTTKLLFLSIVWRGNESSLPEFKTVRLSRRDAANIKSMLAARDPGTVIDYPLNLALIRPPDHGGLFTPWTDSVGSISRITFLAGNVGPNVWVTRRRLAYPANLCSVQEDGSALCLAIPQRQHGAVKRAHSLVRNATIPQRWLDER